MRRECKVRRKITALPPAPPLLNPAPTRQARPRRQHDCFIQGREVIGRQRTGNDRRVPPRPALYDQRRPLAGSACPGRIHILVEQLRQLLHHRAAQLLGIDDRYRAAIIPRHIMTDPDSDQLHLIARLDIADHLAQVLLQIIARIDRQRANHPPARRR